MHMDMAYFSKFPQEAESYPLPDYREVLPVPVQNGIPAC